jgi:hypothetical protein
MLKKPVLVRVVVQAVNRWVQAQVKSCGTCGGQSGTGAGFSVSTLVSPASYHSTDCHTFMIIIITIIYYPGQVQ